MQTFLRLPKQHKLILGCSAFLFTTALFLPSEDVEAAKSTAVTNVQTSQRISIPVPSDITDTDRDQPIYVEANVENIETANSKTELTETISQLTNNPLEIVEKTPVIETPDEEVKNLASQLAETNLAQATPEIIDTNNNKDMSESISAITLLAGDVATLEPGLRYNLSLSEELLIEEQANDFEDTKEWQSFRVRKGDNLAKLFSRAGLSAQEVHHVSRAGKDAKKLLKMMPGEEVRLLLQDDGSFSRLEYDFSNTRTLVVEKLDDKYQSSLSTKEVYSRLNYASGTIDSSFWNAGVKAGLTDNQIMSLAMIFGWDIDFALDIREGDHFNVIYEENYIDGEFVGYGDIVAAEFSNQGEEFAAMLYTDGNYYTPEGRSMRKSFLRAPVSFKYISSNFKPKRFHPVLKRWKAHNGIDYAANSGTPVVASGDGRVIEASYNKYNGNYVFIQHGDTYTTKYLHFTKRAVKKGQWVKQGQVIGYVGMTGLATAPHLHYEFLVNGKHQNPRTVKLPKALPIARAEKSKFLELAQDYQAKLDMNRRIMLAMN